MVTKTLLLLRHAKSDWGNASLDDHDRPLNQRGTRAAETMGAYLEREGLTPAVILCSTARRTRDTLELVTGVMSTVPEVRLEPLLYLAPSLRIRRMISDLEDVVDTVMVIGHNPGMENLAAELAVDGPLDALRDLDTKYPTGTLAVFRINGSSWASLEDGDGYLERFVRPKDIKYMKYS